jgi:uroporphyrinogen decarboxylase
VIDRVERLPKPQPEAWNVLAVLRRGVPERVPLLELKFDDEVMAALLGEPYVPWSKAAPAELRERHVRQYVGLWHRLGYDAFRLRTDIPFRFIRERAADTAVLSRGQRQWQNEHCGPIQTLEDVARYRWPTLADVDFGPVEEIRRALPDGMALIGFVGGPFEWATWLMGLEHFCLALYDCPELIREVMDRVGGLIYECLDVWARSEGVPILWLADDLGFKTATLIGAEHLREHILPWYRKYADLAHRHGKPLMLHSCGNLGEVYPDLADTVGIDAKHSFEDVIQPVEEFHRQWGSKMAAIGGVDVDLLARSDEDAIRRRTMEILEVCAPRGAYAAGSGNSVTNYIPVEHYLAMVETVHQFNGRI